MTRPRGGFIGYNAAPAASALNSAASGVWTLREAEALKRAGTWPLVAVPLPVTSGLQLWLDASDASTLFDATSGGSLVAADGAVARWEDKSGNGRHATQSTSGDRPLRKTAIQGGLDVLRFDGTSDFMTVPSSTAAFKFLHDGDSTVFLVLKAGTSANPGHGRYTLLSNIRDGASTRVGVEVNHRDSDPSTENDFLDLVIVKGVSGNIPVLSSNNNFFASGTFGVVSAVLKPDNATSGNRVSLRRNGGTASTANSPVGANQSVSTANADQDLNISRRPGGTFAADGFLNGDYCEIIMYDSGLSDTDRAAVENYLLSKWGIT
jgi:hypothetical protein